MPGAPWFWLVAGPNGAGKTSSARKLLGEVLEIVNPDVFAARLSPHAPENAALGAGREAIKRTRILIAQGGTFAVETTLSGRSFAATVRLAQSRGFSVGLIYIGLASARLAIARVRDRRTRGGHDVPAQDVRRRYVRGLRNLSGFAVIADRALFFDNSSSTHPLRRILELNDGERIFRQARLPTWIRRAPGMADLYRSNPGPRGR
ncbi:MAG TPA: AAA family ATPase [Candidatus Binataceae bacterium]|nr:AAA family ATPase [Candidatus Binataceae bacterium]